MSDNQEMKLHPGGDFCRVVKGSNGQQVLLRADADDTGKIALVASAVFRVGGPDGAPILAHQILEDVDINQALGFSGTPELMFEYADALLSDLETLLIHQMAHEALAGDGEDHVHDEHCAHG